ncbi:MBL fold metallo-hydrolase [Tropicimonas isoalkanivorans]|uniref:Glyoxylase, beta-lactamase superfamily II n=1 Tax=Tropicimonas isoalkanivorans TaxID=441112 RepID=A0A1I1KT07_9RHOB|nr:MBL fold metallo-hydrolase [Tropicimonas isoalkanivorans]SFC63392.1 Glyoxylase, beta-lactamase superfamily II [Tropicimonas isoalkanivorans]
MDRRHFMMTASASLLAAGSGAIVPIRVRAADGGMQVTAAQRFRVGDMTVTAMSDGFIPLDPSVMQGIEPEGAARILEDNHYDPANIHGSVNTYLVETGGDTWLIDSGADGVFGPTLGGVAGVMQALGKDPAAISKLIITHMHGDHIGGAVMDGSSFYPNAELVVTESDVNFWTSDEIQAKAPDAFKGAFDLAKGVIAAYGDRVKTISGEADVAPGIVARPLPGHTVGHTGYMLESKGQSLLIWGDTLVVAAIQLAKPEVTTVYDTDPAQSVATRKDLLASVAGTGQMVAGMHMPFPGVGYVESAGEAYAFTPAHWEYF